MLTHNSPGVRPCAECGTPTRSGTSPIVCPRCRCKLRCPICGKLIPGKPKGSWCRPCFEDYTRFTAVMKRFGDTPPPTTMIPHLVQIYRARAAKGADLFERPPRFDCFGVVLGAANPGEPRRSEPARVVLECPAE